MNKEYNFIETNNRLNSPKNYRWTTPRCCPTCKFFEHKKLTDDSWGSPHEVGCIRPDGERVADGDWMDLWTRICDYWTENPDYWEE